MKSLVLAIVALVGIVAAHAAEWQYSTPTPNGKGRAFLWIPPECKYVRGVVLSGQVILEKCVMEDPRIRAAAAKENLALVIDMKSTIGKMSGDGTGKADIQKILDDLAAVSGYSELSQAPVLTIGHSGGAIFAWHVGYAMPDRCFGVIGLHAAPIGPFEGLERPKGDGGLVLNDVPVLDISGQYESWGMPGRTPEYHWRWVRGTLLEYRALGHNPLLSELVEVGTNHFSWYDELADYVGLFIQKAAKYRIPSEPPAPGTLPTLRTIPQEAGWLTDVSFFQKPCHQTAAFKEYTGDPTLAFWHFDEEIARANDQFGASSKGKEFQQIAFTDEGNIVKPAWICEVPFRPLEDGMTVRLSATFLGETSPEFSVPSPRKLGHAEGPIQYRLIGGWCGGGKQTGPDTFRICMDRFEWVRPSGSIMAMAWHPGDARYSRYEQPVNIKYPSKNKEGTPQTITFAPIADQKIGTGSIQLSATSSAGLPVDFCMIEGPGEIEGNKLTFSKIPVRSKRPVKVTVAASQWGRSTDPKTQSAEVVVQSFNLN